MNGKYQLLFYADDVKMLGENLQTLRENTEIFIKASKDIGLEVNSDKTKYKITSRHQNVVPNQNIVIGNLSFEKVEKFKYLGQPLWSKWQHARLSRSGPRFDPRSGQVSWVRFSRVFPHL